MVRITKPLNAVCNDFRDITLAAILRIICAGLNAAINGHPAALVKILIHKVCGLTPCHYGQEIGIICAILILVVALYGHLEAGTGNTALRRERLRVCCNSADNDYTVNKSFLLIFYGVQSTVYL